MGVAADLGTHGSSSDYLDRVRQQFTHTHETNVHLNQEWLAWLMTAYYYGDDPALFLNAPSGFFIVDEKTDWQDAFRQQSGKAERPAARLRAAE